MAFQRPFGQLCAVAILSVALVRGVRAQDAGFQWQALGAATYAASCGACHQPNGQGVAGGFPPLAGHAPALLALPGGRDYLIRLVLYGLQGEITVGGKTFNGVMPAWGAILNDAQLAAALDYALNSWGNDAVLPPGTAPVTPADIAAARAKPMDAAAMYALRQQVAPTEQAQPAESTPLAFTADQADRGRTAYRKNCQDCHGGHLNDGEFGGAPLTGEYFRKHWGNGSVAALYGYMRQKMPLDRPGRLNPETYADLTAFLLANNGYQPTDQELPPLPEVQARMSLKR